MRPRIVLTTSRAEGPAADATRARYVTALEAGGADVVVVRPDGQAPSSFDGLCLSGGEDVDPARYGAENVACERIDGDRDELEDELLRRALAADAPILGICRGFQVLNVAFDGGLVQHRDGHRPGSADEVVPHVVTPLPGSLLASVSGGAPFTVNSRHHQVVTARELAPALRATASVDDVIEAFESPSHRFVLGVQWHPERTAEVAPEARRVFAAFVAAAARAPAPAG